MSRANTGDGNNYLYAGTAARAALPITLVCWARMANATSTASLVNITNDAATAYVSLVADGNNEYTLGAARVVADPAGVSTAVASSSAYVANQWFHAAAVFDTSTSRAAYLNGGAKGTSSATRALGTPTSTSLGGFRVPGTTYGPMNGELAEVAIYNVALSDAEILLLSKGYSPLQVRRESLVAYWPLNKGPLTLERDEIGGLNLPLFGSMRPSGDPPLILPRQFHREWLSEPAGGSSAAITSASGVATTSTLTGSSAAASSITSASGAATSSTLTASSTAAAAITSASGAATASTLTASSIAASAITSASGVATSSTLGASSVAEASLSSASGVATASTMTGVAGSGSSITAAAGVATTSTLTGSSVAVSAITSASGVATASTVTGSSVAESSFSSASGVATASTLTGTVGGSAITPASGLASASVIAGSSIVVAEFAPAAGVATTSTMADAAASVIPTMPPYVTVYFWQRTA